jgi:hypothetical protein
MVTTGVMGRDWRASITGRGAIEPWDGSPRLDWFVAADDRWHVPSQEPSVRQRRVEGTPVTETRVRVPHGDVVQTVYSCADAGGITIVEVVNESTLPVAVAFDRRAVLTERETAPNPVRGITLPDEAFALPLGHRARLRIGVVHDTPRTGLLPPGLPTAAQVVKGWTATVGRGSALEIPDEALVERAVAERCELLLRGPVAPADDPVAFAVGVGELTRLGERAAPWIADLAAIVESIAPRAGWDADVALAAVARSLSSAGERRALADLDRIRSVRPGAPRPNAAPDGILCVPWLETLVADGHRLFPGGVPREWWGESLEAHGVPTGPSSSVSLAVRWHGARPALLWEQHGTPVELVAPVVAPGWSTAAVSGEVLWPEPA